MKQKCSQYYVQQEPYYMTSKKLVLISLCVVFSLKCSNRNFDIALEFSVHFMDTMK